VIPLFAGYALLVWFPACIYRRRWEGFAAIVLGLAGLLAMAALHLMLSRATQGRIFAPVFQGIFYPYIALVIGMALFLFVLPRHHPPGTCARCGYDLDGAPESQRVCPECGAPIPLTTKRGRCRACGHNLTGHPDQGRCPTCRTQFVHPPQPAVVREAQRRRWVEQPALDAAAKGLTSAPADRDDSAGLEPVDEPGQEDDERQPGEEPPSDRRTG